MAGRAKQMEDLKANREEEEAQYKMEVAKLKEDWKLYLRELEAEKAAKAEKQARYRRELDCQVQYNDVRQVIQLKEKKYIYLYGFFLDNWVEYSQFYSGSFKMAKNAG